ncbi:MAG: hypothetical protein IJX28_01020 [Clostridia bacterium]|nr:hypothetical protein [Clostridia bacterium]
MGKGRRNRELHLQDKINNPEKYKEKKKMPSWLPSVIAIAIVVAIIAPLIVSGISGTGVIERNRVLIESQSGKFDVNQQVAMFIAWEALYENALTYYQYYQYGLIEDTYKITDTYEMEEYAIMMAQSNLQTNLRDSIDAVVESLKQYVAVCDKAYSEGITLTDEEKAQVDEVLSWVKSMQTSYGYTTLNKFLGTAIGNGMKEKDVRKATEMIILFNKYVEMKELEFDAAITLEDLTKYRDENPATFFKIDYLTFATQNKEYAEQLKACTTEKEFKELVAKLHFDDNYKTLYNKYTTTVLANSELAAVKTLIDGNGDTALSKKLDELKVEAVKEFTKGEEGLNEDLSNWLFATTRKTYESAVVTTENGVYLVSFFSEAASTEKVNARVKFYEFVEGEAHETDTEFKNTLLKIFTENNNGTKDEDKSKHDYKTAAEKAELFGKELEAENADIIALLNGHNATKTNITKESKESDTLPQEIIELALEDTTEKGKAYSVLTEAGEQYVVYIHDLGDQTAETSYFTVEADLFIKVLNDLQTGLNKAFSSKSTAAFAPEAEEGTYQAWLSEVTEGTNSVRKNGETTIIEKTEKDSKTNEETTTYNVYMALENTTYGSAKMLYLNTDTVVNGGYLLFTDATKAQTAADSLKGKTGTELLEALAALTSDKSGTTANTSVSYTKDSLTSVNEALAIWFFDSARVGNEISVIPVKDSEDKVTANYVAVYVDSAESWARTARTNLLSEQVTDMIKDLASSYTVSEKTLQKLGTPSTTAATTAAATTAA